MAHRRTLPARRIAAAFVIASIFGMTACPNGEGETTHPPPEVYGDATDFSGAWQGEVGDVNGELRIEALGDSRYYANFRGKDHPVRYILSLDQVPAQVAGDGSAPSNLCRFTWQDGRGGRGEGWLLINRDLSALTGTFGRGDGDTGMGVWTFIREGEAGGGDDQAAS